MKLAHYSEKKLKKEILEIVGKYLNLKKYKVFFFGSRIEKNNSDRSDIDIGIEGPKKISTDIIFKIKEKIDKLPILYKIDIVDFKDVSGDFYKVAKQDIEIIK